MPLTRPYDVADYLTNDAFILTYLEEAFATDEPELIAAALAAVARARSREVREEQPDPASEQALQALLNAGDSTDLKTALQALKALGLKLTPALRTSEQLAA